MKKSVVPQVPPLQKQDEIRDREEVEAMIDETVAETFPASDPPAWGAIARRCEAAKNQEADSKVTDEKKKNAA